MGRTWFPLGIVVLSLIVDSFAVNTPVSGVFGIVALGCMSFYVPPRELFIWGVILTAVFSKALWLGASETGDWWTFAFRMATFIGGGVFCIVSASLRVRLETTRDDLLAILSSLPSPVLIADGNGTIQFCNKKMQELFGKQEKELMGGSFFSFFSDPQHRGQGISRFLNWIDNGVQSDASETFTILTDPPRKIRAVISITTLRENPSLLVSVIPS